MSSLNHSYSSQFDEYDLSARDVDGYYDSDGIRCLSPPRFRDGELRLPSPSSCEFNDVDDDDDNGDYDHPNLYDLIEIPIEKFDVGCSLPDLPQKRRLNPSKRDRTSIWFGLSFSMILLVVLGAASLLRRERSRDPVLTDPKEILVVEFLRSRNLIHSGDLRPSSSSSLSPQYQAIQWLAKEERVEEIIPRLSFQSIENKTSTDNLTKYEHDCVRYETRYIMTLNYFAMAGSTNWRQSLNFLSSDSVCNWHDANVKPPKGLFCDENSVPDRLILAGNQLMGTIPKENSKLTTLRILDFQSNELAGSLPTELCQLTNLEDLFLGNNTLKGNVPDCIHRLVKLKTLSLGSNNLSGTLPTEAIQKMPSLEYLVLDRNSLKGDILNAVSPLKNLRWIVASHNQFTGIFDRDSFKFRNGLQRLEVGHNQITSKEFPAAVTAIRTIEVIDIGNNQLHGIIPANTHWSQSIRFINMNGNYFHGSIPDALSTLSSLTHLYLAGNRFDGIIPTNLGTLKQLQALSLADNPALTKGVIPDSFQNLVNLKELSLSGTNRNGTLPEFIGSHLQALELLDLSDNVLSGRIPDGWKNMQNMRHFVLKNNTNITGTVPTSFKSMGKLKTFHIHGTNVTGSLLELCKLTKNENSIFATCGEKYVTTCECCVCCNKQEDESCEGRIIADLEEQSENKVLSTFAFITGGAD